MISPSQSSYLPYPPPVDCCYKADVYIDDTPTLSLDTTKTLAKARAANLFSIHIVERPLATIEPIPREEMACIKKLLAEGALSEIKITLGWEIDTRRLLIRLTNEKIRYMIQQHQDHPLQ